MNPSPKILIGRLGIVIAAALAMAACATEDRVSGVPHGITFAVTPVYPNSYDITASGSRHFSSETMKDSWLKKAAQLAHGRKYKTSGLTVHDNERVTDNPYVPIVVEGRTVSGTLIILGN
jgi:hypothetical protein